MSEVKVGDRVRVVIEDSVYGMGAGGTIGIDAGWFRADLPGVVSIEVIPAPFVLPTKRWAQVVDNDGMLWTRQALDSEEKSDRPSLPQWFNSVGANVSSAYLLCSWSLRVISEGVDDEWA
jgi:hypothetical protein